MLMFMINLFVLDFSCIESSNPENPFSPKSFFQLLD
jgi:hypothetical protein